MWQSKGCEKPDEHLWFEVPTRRGFVNITQTVEELVRKRGVQEGFCLVNAMHITAAVFINDNESGLLHDYDVWLEKLAPHAPTLQYEHNRTGEDNADAQLTVTLIAFFSIPQRHCAILPTGSLGATGKGSVEMNKLVTRIGFPILARS